MMTLGDLILGGLIVLGATNPVASQAASPAVDLATIGPSLGKGVPAFVLPDQKGQPRSLESIMGPKGAMLVFFRSADW